ncbi:MAG: hypothetical protein AABX23_05060 [Nanoarchaeota archaeon]
MRDIKLTRHRLDIYEDVKTLTDVVELALNRALNRMDLPSVKKQLAYFSEFYRSRLDQFDRDGMVPPQDLKVVRGYLFGEGFKKGLFSKLDDLLLEYQIRFASSDRLKVIP